MRRAKISIIGGGNVGASCALWAASKELGVETAWPDVITNGSLEARFHGNLNMAFPGIDGDMLIAKLRDLAVSSGAACASAETGPSYVLKAIGLGNDLADSSIRFGFGRYTSQRDADFAADQLIDALRILEPSPKKRAHG